MLELSHACVPTEELLAQHQSHHHAGCWRDSFAFTVLILWVEASEKIQIFIASFELFGDACCEASLLQRCFGNWHFQHCGAWRGQWGLWDSVSLLHMGLLPGCPLPHCPLPLICCHGEQIWSCTLMGPMWLFSARVICCHCGHHNNWAFSFFFLIYTSLHHISFSAA